LPKLLPKGFKKRGTYRISANQYLSVSRPRRSAVKKAPPNEFPENNRINPEVTRVMLTYTRSWRPFTATLAGRRLPARGNNKHGARTKEIIEFGKLIKTLR
jgi:hypothetical protein